MTDAPASPTPPREPPINLILALVIFCVLAFLAYLIIERPQAAPWQPAPDQAKSDPRIPELEAKIAALDAALRVKQETAVPSNENDVPSDVSEKMAALENQMRLVLASQPAATAQETAAVKENLAGAESRLEAIEKKLSTFEKRQAASAAWWNGFYHLTQAVLSGKPYAAEYDTFADLMAEEPEVIEALKALDNYADTGIPTPLSLEHDFEVVSKQALAPIPGKEDGLGEKLVVNLRGLVTVRKVGADQTGKSPEAILARAEAHLQQSEIEAAVAEIVRLPGARLAFFGGWLEDAHMYISTPVALASVQDSLMETANARPVSGN